MSEGRIIQYFPEDTLADFHADRHSRVKAVMGPYGSGKSTGDVMDLLMLAQEQEPFKGVRDVRTAVIRNTYPELKSTTIKTWQEWIPDSFMPIKYDAPIIGRTNQLLPDGTVLRWEVLFLALDRPDHVSKLKSLELTNAWVNEASELPWAIIEHLDARIDRYPPKYRGGATRPCILMDTNAPDTDSRFYETFETLKPKGWTLYRQPAALIEAGDYLIPNPAATYAQFQNSGYGYWANMAQGKTKEWINVYIKGDYGTVFTGKPVWAEYVDGLHYCPEPLEVFPGIPLIVGMDFGLTPACAIMQLLPNGQLRIIDELISDSMGIRQFARDALRPHLSNHYPGHPVVIYGDPAGLQRSQVSDEETCLKELAKQGFMAMPAHTNSFIARREAVAGFLTTMARGGEPAFVIGPKAPTVRKAFMGGYQFGRVAVSGQEERYHDEPIKNRFSHVSDGVQYGALMVTTPVESKITSQTVRARPVARGGRIAV
jgi:hypothetical protein